MLQLAADSVVHAQHDSLERNREAKREDLIPVACEEPTRTSYSSSNEQSSRAPLNSFDSAARDHVFATPAASATATLALESCRSELALQACDA